MMRICRYIFEIYILMKGCIVRSIVTLKPCKIKINTENLSDSSSNTLYMALCKYRCMQKYMKHGMNKYT